MLFTAYKGYVYDILLVSCLEVDVDSILVDVTDDDHVTHPIFRTSSCRKNVVLLQNDTTVWGKAGGISYSLNALDPLGYFSFQPVPHDWCNKEGRKCFI